MCLVWCLTTFFRGLSCLGLGHLVIVFCWSFVVSFCLVLCCLALLYLLLSCVVLYSIISPCLVELAFVLSPCLVLSHLNLLLFILKGMAVSKGDKGQRRNSARGEDEGCLCLVYVSPFLLRILSMSRLYLQHAWSCLITPSPLPVLGLKSFFVSSFVFLSC